MQVDTSGHTGHTSMCVHRAPDRAFGLVKGQHYSPEHCGGITPGGTEPPHTRHPYYAYRNDYQLDTRAKEMTKSVELSGLD